MSKHYPQLKLSTGSKRDLKKLKPVELKTTLLTEKGPAVGTIWQTSFPEALIVESSKGGVVRYEGENWDYLCDFMDGVEDGSYVLVGVCHPIHCYVPHVIA